MVTLNDLVLAAKTQQMMEMTVETLEKSLKIEKEKQRKQSQEIVPNMMAEMGIESFTLDNGYKVSIKDTYFASIPEANLYACFEWLRQSGLDGIIKTVVAANFGKGEDQEAQKVLDLLTQAGVVADVKSTIHPQTLKAFIKERITKGLDLDLELFGATVVKTTVISK
jgi:hypothetical protein